ncbi:hypothetical protein M9H77_32060 [Catharanthus roseus]|uniref:Uncharacterized protein n=1 Tax=Catharanthus roseus TaxID=4058 RepID=A0ACC0A493_CATRO|nr:hypothetical protein M9H77_32060 [Catharanthus roseus]
MKTNTYLIINWYMKSRTSDRRTYVTFVCECGGALRKNTKPRIDDEEEEVPIKKWGPYGIKKCGCLFKLKGEQMATSENWQLFVHDGRHNLKIAVYNHCHAQAARLTKEYAHKLYNVVAKFKKNRMQGRNTVGEVLYLSAQWGYIVFYGNGENNNVLSDIIVAHPTSIAMIKMWPYEPPVSAPHHVMSLSSHSMACGSFWCQTATSQQMLIITEHWGAGTYMTANV